MNLARWLLDALNSGIVRLLCRVDDEQMARFPQHGPLIMLINHVNMLEVLVLRSRLRPRRVFGLAKAETWDNPILGRIFDLWDAIPIRRGESDLAALRRALGVLKEGHILGIAPEGTRSGHGRLQRGHPGMTTIALKSNAPLQPIVFYGGEAVVENMRRLRRTPFHFVVGDLFTIDLGGERPTRDVRQKITDEIMYRMAALLPERYRGEYADLDQATQDYLRFPQQ